MIVKVKKVLFVILALSMVLGIFTACQPDDRIQLNIYNVGDYINEDVIDIFEEENPDIKINYETYYANEEMYVKVANKSSDYDVIFPSDYMKEKMKSEGLLNKINFENIPNYEKISPEFKGLDYDKNEEYSVPYMWGTMGILYNKSLVKEDVTSWKILWDEKYAKNIFMLDTERDTLGITLKMLGYSLNSGNEKELKEAKEALIKQKPLVLAYCGDEVKDKMINAEAALSVVWSGDAYYCMSQNEDLAYAIPSEGSNLWFDAMVIPTTSKHQAEAERFINFMCRPDIAKMNVDYIEYSTPIGEVKEQLSDDVKNDKMRYPDITKINNLEIFSFDKELTKKYSEIWQEIKISN